MARKVLSSKVFKAGKAFEAYHSATKYLHDLGYKVGIMDCGNMIGFAPLPECGYISKWTNMTSEEHTQVSGVIRPDPGFRDGGAIVEFYTEPIVTE